MRCYLVKNLWLVILRNNMWLWRIGPISSSSSSHVRCILYNILHISCVQGLDSEDQASLFCPAILPTQPAPYNILTPSKNENDSNNLDRHFFSPPPSVTLNTFSYTDWFYSALATIDSALVSTTGLHSNFLPNIYSQTNDPMSNQIGMFSSVKDVFYC